MSDAYVETLGWLYRLQARAGIQLKLERVRSAAQALGHPERAAPTIHVAGTNGKGSTVAMLAAILRDAGHRVGVFSSPHLVSFCERITIGGVPITEDEVVEGVAHVRRTVPGGPEGLGLTSFEIMTLLAWWTFARHGVDVVVLEVGLGGRLDATNVVTPAVTIITNVAVDHEAFLGSDLEGIAGEKAGIIKPGVPVVAGGTGVAAQVIRARAETLGSAYQERGIDFDLTSGAGVGDGLVFRSPMRTIDDLHLRLQGRHQQANAALALRALELMPAFVPSPESVRAGLARADWPGRLQLVRESPRVLLDCAHNPAAIDVVVDEVRASAAGRTVRVLFGVMQDKSWHRMLESLARLATEIVLTRPRQARSADPRVLADAVSIPHRVDDDPERAYRTLVERSAPDDLVLVTGSIFLVGDVLPVVEPAYRVAAARERQAAVQAEMLRGRA